MLLRLNHSFKSILQEKSFKQLIKHSSSIYRITSLILIKKILYYREIVKEMANVCGPGRPGIWHRRRASLAPVLVWSEGLFPVARIESLQNARAGPAFALSDIHDLPDVRRAALSTGFVAL